MSLSGLQKICKMYGAMQCGDTLFVWDYAKDVAVPRDKMKVGSKRWKESEKARWTQNTKPTPAEKI